MFHSEGFSASEFSPEIAHISSEIKSQEHKKFKGIQLFCLTAEMFCESRDIDEENGQKGHLYLLLAL